MSKRLQADLALGFCALIWGLTFVAVKDSLADASVFAFLAVRFSLAAAVMGLMFAPSLRGMNARAVWAGAQIGFFMFGGFVLQTTGLKFTTPSKSAFITGSSVIIVPLMLAAFTRRRINPWVWAGVLATLIGLYFLSVPPSGFSGLNLGDPVALGGATMFALHVIFIGRYTARHSVAALSLVQVATTAVLSALALPIFALTRLEPLRFHLTGMLVYGILITAIGSTAVGFSLQTWAQRHTPATHTAILISLEGVFAAFFSWLFGREHLAARSLFGAALIFAGILLAELKGPAPAAPESPEPVVPSGE